MLEYREILIQELGSPSVERRRLAAQELGKNRILTPVQKEQIQGFLASENDPETLRLLQEVLEEVSATVSTWDGLIQEKDVAERKIILRGLPVKGLGDRERMAIRDWLRAETQPEILCGLLGKMRLWADQSDIPVLRGLLDHSWGAVRSMALALVTRIDPVILAGDLPAMLKSSDARIRLGAINALEKLLPDEAGRLMRGALASENAEERILALHAAFTFDFNQIAVSVFHLLINETDRNALRLAGLLAVTNPDPEMAVNINMRSDSLPEKQGAFLKGLAVSIMKAARLAQLLPPDRSGEEWLTFLTCEKRRRLAEKKKSRGTGKKGTLSPQESVTPTDAPSQSPSSPLSSSALVTPGVASPRLRMEPEEWGKKLSSPMPETVLEAIEELRKSNLDFLLLHRQKLLRHPDARVRLRGLILTEASEPTDMQRELRFLLSSKDARLQQDGMKLAFLMDADAVIPILLEKYDETANEEIRKKIEIFFINNPSSAILNTIILKQSRRMGGRPVTTELVERIYESLKVISDFPLKPLEELVEKLLPPDVPLCPEVVALGKTVQAISRKDARSIPAPSVWGGLASGLTEALLRNTTQMAGFFLVTIIVLLVGSLLFPREEKRGSQAKIAMSEALGRVASSPVEVMGRLLALGEGKTTMTVETGTGKIQVLSPKPFAHLKVGDDIHLIGIPREVKIYGVPRLNFQEWIRKSPPEMRKRE